MTEDDCLQLTQAIVARNKLNHRYESEEFRAILARRPGYALIMQRILTTLQA